MLKRIFYIQTTTDVSLKRYLSIARFKYEFVFFWEDAIEKEGNILTKMQNSKSHHLDRFAIKIIFPSPEIYSRKSIYHEGYHPLGVTYQITPTVCNNHNC